MSPWNWQPRRSEGIWRHGPLWLKPLAVAVPWITVALLLVMLNVVSGSLASAQGVLFDLPDSGLSDGAPAGLVVLAMPKAHDTLLFLDDARYTLGDGVSAAAFARHVADLSSKSSDRTMLLLADRRVSCGELSKIAALVRLNGVERLLFANKQTDARSE